MPCAAAAPYLVALDADDELDPEYLEKTASRLDAESSLGFVTTGIQAFGAASYVWTPPECSVRNALARGTAHACTMFRRSMWEAVGGFSPDSECEDLDFFLTAMIAGHRGAVVPEPLLRYRVRGGAMHQTAVARGTSVDSTAMWPAQEPGKRRAHVVLDHVVPRPNAEGRASDAVDSSRSLLTLGPVELLVANVGGPAAGTFDAMDNGAWQAAISAVLMPAVRLSRAVLPSMRLARLRRSRSSARPIGPSPTPLS